MNTVQVKWNPPRNGMTKLNIDSIVHHAPGPGGMEGSLEIVKADGLGLPQSCCPHYAGWSRAKGYQKRTRLAIQYGFKCLEIESDAQTTLIHILKNNSLYDNLILECRFLLSKLETLVLCHDFREQNRTADCKAREGASLGSFGNLNIFLDPPDFVLNHIYADSVGTLYPRNLANINSHWSRNVASGQFKNVLYNY